MFCIKSKTSLSLEATTIAVGTPTDTSSAWLGPDKTAILQPGISLSTTSSNVDKVSFSKPFEHIIIG